MIAGFDMESNQLAADGTVYDNGYGICLIPMSRFNGFTTWNDSNTLTGAYMGSVMHNTHLPNIVTNLQNILGSHIVNRNVLLSSSVDSNGYSNGYTWTTAYATLMSVGQLTGTFAAHRNNYDDGEANYKLPVFNSIEYWPGSGFWLRNIYGSYYGDYDIWYVSGSNTINLIGVFRTSSIRPLIYIR